MAPGVRSRSVDLKIFDTMMKSLEQEEWKKGSDYLNHACNDYDDLVSRMTMFLIVVPGSEIGMTWVDIFCCKSKTSF